jgi:hypothetical protein
VQRHGRLAGARAALHDQHSVERRPDDPVLLGLDGLDDVPHPAGAARGQRGEQRRLAGQSFVDGVAGRLQVEHLVVEPHDGAAAGADLPAPLHAVGGGRGRQVERPGRRRPPVHQQRAMVVRLVEDTDAPDVPRLGPVLFEVEPAEAEPGLHRAVLGHLVGVEGNSAVALGLRLWGAAGLAQQRREAARGLLAHFVQPSIQSRDVSLLVGNVRGVA